MGESLYVSSRGAAAKREHKTYEAGLCRVLSECYRVLKDDGIMVFTFHHRAEAAWEALGNALNKAQFRVTTVFPVRSEGTSQFHSSAGNLKWDAVFCCRKRRDGDHRKRSNIANLAKKDTATWVKKLRASKLGLSEADRLNLTRAFLTMYRCNLETSVGEVKL
jgi:adenine-specific DNA methylase